MTEKYPDLTVPRVARLAALLEARKHGWLEGKTFQEIGDLLGVNRSTIMRNLRELDEYEQSTGEFLSRLENLKR
jgi:DNA-binding MarR family transcriptional regulator